MDFAFDNEIDARREELSEFLAVEKRQAKETGLSGEEFGARLWARMAKRGWLGIFLPKEYGGLGKKPVEFAAFIEALHHFGSPEVLRTWLDINSYVAATIAARGSADARERFLTAMCSGSVRCSIAWTEPEGGADGGLHTARAKDAGDHFVLNGTKIYNESHRCNYTCAVIKTDPSAPRGKGHSMMMVDLNSPGVSINPLWTMWGLRRDELVFEDVVVPKENLIGELNEGWDYWYKDTQCYEWAILANVGLLRRDFEKFLRFLSESPSHVQMLGRECVRDVIAEMATRLEIGRHLFYRAWTSASPLFPNLGLAAMGKVYVTESLWDWLYSSMLDLVGEPGRLAGQKQAYKWPVIGLGLGTSYEFGPALAIGGMPTEIQRDVIARDILNLPDQL